MKITRTELENSTAGKNWQGYIWMVEGQHPNIYDNETIDWTQLNKTGNVFNRIQEANFFNESENMSIHIKNIDGEELAFMYDLKNIESNKNELLLEHLIEDVTGNPVAVPSSKGVLKPLLFKQLYKNTPSPISEGFETWLPVCKIFVGFSK